MTRENPSKIAEARAFVAQKTHEQGTSKIAEARAFVAQKTHEQGTSKFTDKQHLKGNRPNLKCNYCNSMGHNMDRCWILHPDLKPRNLGNRQSGNQKKFGKSRANVAAYEPTHPSPMNLLNEFASFLEEKRNLEENGRNLGRNWSSASSLQGLSLPPSSSPQPTSSRRASSRFLVPFLESLIARILEEEKISSASAEDTNLGRDGINARLSNVNGLATRDVARQLPRGNAADVAGSAGVAAGVAADVAGSATSGNAAFLSNFGGLSTRDFTGTSNREDAEKFEGTYIALLTALELSKFHNLWVVDSGASDHMTHNLNKIHDFTSFPIPSFVSIANGSTAAVKGKKKLKLRQNILILIFYMCLRFHFSYYQFEG